MKKLMYFCCAVVFVILAVLAVFNYQFEIIERIERGKQTIQIEKPEAVSNKDFLNSMNEKLQTVHCDLMYRYVDVKNESNEYVYFRTYNTEDFVSKAAESDNTYKGISISFRPLTEAYIYNQSCNTYFVPFEDVDTVMDAINELGYQVSERPSAIISGKLSAFAFATIPILMFLAAIIFYVLSISREAVLKKLDGYGTVDLTIEFVKRSGVVFGMIGIIVFAATALFGKIVMHAALIMDFMEYVLKYMLSGCAVICCGYFVALVVFAGYKRVSQIKGQSSKKLIYVGASVLRLFIMIFAVYFLAISVQNLYSIYLTEQTLKNQKEKISGYVTIPIYAHNKSIDGLEPNYYQLYLETLEKYQGVLVYARNFYYDPMTDSTRGEEFDQDYIMINENYLNINPIFDIHENPITADFLDQNKVNLLVPQSRKDRLDIIKEKVELGYDCETNTIYYDDSNTILYSYNQHAMKNTKGIIESPFIVVGNDKIIREELIYTYLTSDSYFFKPETDHPDTEIIPLLEKYELTDTTFGVSSIEDNFRIELDDVKKGLVFYGIQAAILLFSIMAMSIFNTKLYFSIYKKRISICMLEGYSVWTCLSRYLLLVGISYLIAIAIGLLVINSEVKVNPLMFVVMMMMEGLIFFVFVRKTISDNLNESMKGA